MTGRGFFGTGRLDACFSGELNGNYNPKTAKEFVDGAASTNGVESVWAVLKRMHYGTYHHFSKKHLRRYVDECAFRLNDGNVRIDTMDRLATLAKKSGDSKITYKQLVA